MTELLLNIYIILHNFFKFHFVTRRKVKIRIIIFFSFRLYAKQQNIQYLKNMDSFRILALKHIFLVCSHSLVSKNETKIIFFLGDEAISLTTQKRTSKN